MTSNKANSRYEIMVENINDTIKYMLDLYDEEMVTLNMSVCEIQDITTRNSTFSKTITIPDTNHNRKVFGFISELNSDATLFNPNKKSPCTIFIDTIPVFIGTLQLKNVKYNFKTGEVKIETVFYSNVLDFYKNIGEKYLTDLTGLSRLSHTYSVDNIMYSWTQSQSFGYYYPLIDYGRLSGSQSGNQYTETPWGFDINNMGGSAPYNQYIKTQQFYPALYTKTIVDEIFNDAGYTYDSNFFNSDNFKSTIIPFMNKYLVSSFTASEVVCDMDVDGMGYNLIGTATYSGYNYMSFPGYAAGITGGSIVGFTYSSVCNKPFHSSTMSTFNVEIKYNIWPTPYSQVKQVVTSYTTHTSGYYINNNSFNLPYRPSINIISLKGEGPYNNQMYKLLNDQDVPLPYPWNYVKLPTGIRIGWATLKPGATMSKIISWIKLKDIGTIVDSDTYTTNGFSDAAQWTPYIVDGSTTFTPDGYYELEPGEKSFIFFWWRSSTSNLQNIMSINAVIKDNVSDLLRENQPVSIIDNLPKNIKQKDFITNLFKMFNLYIEQDKIIPNMLRIEPRDDYYKYDKVTGEPYILDWTSKVDLDQEISMHILSDTQDKTFIYTYKEDKDYFNGLYKTNTNRVPGDAIKEIDNDFNSGDKKIEIFFGPSVMANIPGYNNFPVVNLSKQISDTKGYPIGSTDINPRILYRKNVDLIYDDIWKIGNNSGTYSMTMSYYPYAGPYDDPYFPKYDLSFEQQLISFYLNTGIVNNNLYNLYHKNQFLEISDINSRILTCEMYLTPVDIYNFYFNYIIYLEIGGQGNYWRVNKIENYDPSGKSTCTVELIKALFPKVVSN